MSRLRYPESPPAAPDLEELGRKRIRACQAAEQLLNQAAIQSVAAGINVASFLTMAETSFCRVCTALGEDPNNIGE